MFPAIPSKSLIVTDRNGSFGCRLPPRPKVRPKLIVDRKRGETCATPIEASPTLSLCQLQDVLGLFEVGLIEHFTVEVHDAVTAREGRDHAFGIGDVFG